jgi:hypothetical protein
MAQAGSPLELHAADVERSRVAPQTKALLPGGGRQALVAAHRLHETAVATSGTHARATGAKAGRLDVETDSLEGSVESYDPIDKRPLEVSSGGSFDSPRSRAPRPRRPANRRSSEREARPAAGAVAGAGDDASPTAGQTVRVIDDQSESSGDARSGPIAMEDNRPQRQEGESRRRRRQPIPALWPGVEESQDSQAGGTRVTYRTTSLTYKGREQANQASAGRAGYEMRPVDEPLALAGSGTVERASDPRPDRQSRAFGRQAGHPEVRIGTIEVRVVQPEKPKPAPAPASRPRYRSQPEATSRRLARGFVSIAGLGQV